MPEGRSCTCAEIVSIRDALEAIAEEVADGSIRAQPDALRARWSEWQELCTRENVTIVDVRNEFCSNHISLIPAACMRGVEWFAWRDAQSALLRSLVEAWSLLPISLQTAEHEMAYKTAIFVAQAEQSLKDMKASDDRKRGGQTRKEDFEDNRERDQRIYGRYLELIKLDDGKNAKKILAREFGLSLRRIQEIVAKEDLAAKAR
jgi:hypothetical protein